MIPLGQLRERAGKGQQSALACSVARQPIVDIGKAVRGLNFVEKFRGVQVDAAQGHPADFQLRVFPQLCFCCEVPLPAVGDVVVVFDALFGAAAGSPIEQYAGCVAWVSCRVSRRGWYGSLVRRQVTVQLPLATRSDRFGSVVRFNSHKNTHWIAREELPDTSAQSEFAGAEDIPSETQAWSNQVIVAGRQGALAADRAARPGRTFVRGTTGQKDPVASRTS